MNFKRISAVALLGFGSIFFSAIGCGTAGADLCDAKCDCERCSDREYDECLIETNADIDVADTYGCSDERGAYEDCVLRKSFCTGRDYKLEKDDCSGQRKVLSDCIDDNSAQ